MLLVTENPQAVPAVKQYEAFIEVSDKTRTPASSRAGKRKSPKDTSVMAGPITLISSLSWTEFLEQIATELEVTNDRLVVGSLRWKLQKPANSQVLGLNPKSGYSFMVRRVQERPEKIPVVTIFMDTPLKQSQTSNSLVSSFSFFFFITLSDFVAME